MALTADTANKKVPTDKRAEYPDGSNGLFLIVQPSGAKSWAVRYKAHTGERRKVTLGAFLHKRTVSIEGNPAISAPHTLAEARRAAAAIMGKVAVGLDPSPKAEARAKSAEASRTVGALIEVFLDAKKSKRTISEMTRRLNCAAVKTIHHKDVEAVKKSEIGMLWGAFRGETEANRTFETLRLFFKWCIGRGIIDQSPMFGLAKPFPDAERERDRVLTDAELAKVWNASHDIGEQFGPLVRLLILTGQRRSESRGCVMANWGTMRKAVRSGLCRKIARKTVTCISSH